MSSDSLYLVTDQLSPGYWDPSWVMCSFAGFCPPGEDSGEPLVGWGCLWWVLKPFCLRCCVSEQHNPSLVRPSSQPVAHTALSTPSPARDGLISLLVRFPK